MQTKRNFGKPSGVDRRRTWRLATILAGSLLAISASAATWEDQGPFDGRLALQPSTLQRPSTQQLAHRDQLLIKHPRLSVRFDPHWGTVRTLWNQSGYLSGPLIGATPEDAVLEYLRGQRELFGLDPNDFDTLRVRNQYTSRVSGATRIFFEQQLDDVPIFNSQLQANINREGRLISINNSLVNNASAHTEDPSTELTLRRAVRTVAERLGASPLLDIEPLEGHTSLSAPELSREPIVGELKWLPIERGRLRKVWNFQLATLDSQHVYDLTVDVETGQIWTRFDWVAGQYRVYPGPIESPLHTTPLPPDDARSLVLSPEDPLASPDGWHEDSFGPKTTLDGNNVHAYEDTDDNDLPPANEPDCGPALECDFVMNLSQEPAAHVSASVTNLFYWSNLIHDVQYQYGFDEAAGNFQSDNFGRGGQPGDKVLAEAHDGGSGGNAFFSTPPDGTSGRMEMGLNFAFIPALDGSLDSSLIAHEYGHGISNRQVGGPSNTGCLQNEQQPGEGWSDWLGLWYTAEAGDSGLEERGFASYYFTKASGGPGVRGTPYSTDDTVNSWTYETIGTGVSVPHGVGAVWAQTLWEVYWKLVDRHGFDENLHNANGGSGNQRAMLYVNEGLQNTICSPTFLDARDGILQAAADSYDGQDVCRIWEAFAHMGLGEDATSVGPNSLSVTNGFALPAECECNPSTDADCDGVLDDIDNCTFLPNVDQRDSNNDTIGNACDPDLNDDWMIDFVDYGLMKDVFFTDDEDADLDGDGTVNFGDLVIMTDLFFGPPGPSGLDPGGVPCGDLIGNCPFTPVVLAELQFDGTILVQTTQISSENRWANLQVQTNGGPWRSAQFMVDTFYTYFPPGPGEYRFRAEAGDASPPEPCETTCTAPSAPVVVP